jgi:hypothetical protein
MSFEQPNQLTSQTLDVFPRIPDDELHIGNLGIQLRSPDWVLGNIYRSITKLEVDGVDTYIAQTLKRDEPFTYHIIDPKTGNPMTSKSLINIRVKGNRLYGDGGLFVYEINPETGELENLGNKNQQVI